MTNAPTDDRRALLQSALQAIDDLQNQLDEARRHTTASIGREPIAIVGMSCRFPGGATSPEAYWEVLRDGRDVVGEYPAQRRAMAEAAGADFGALSEDTKWYGGFLDEIDQFDPQFFGISPREAATMDPQQRLALEVSWEALERAGIAPDSLNGSATGVFIGITSNEYIQLAKLSGPESLDVYSATGGALNAAPGRVSYTLGLQGPSMAIDTACSSSLVALHQACQSLRAGETDMALAGGVNLLLLPEAFVCFDAWGMMASDGRCKTFDAAADGFVRGEGCGIVVLKRLSDAVSAGDPVLAVIRGSAVNQDGRSSGLTVPNGPAQQAVLQQALGNAGVDPADVQYFEAHGTGTTLGDPIEIEAMGAVLGRGRPDDRQVIVGSVKTNIGHLESASGIAGLIKVVLAMQHGMIPPNLHFREPSPQIPWPKFPVVVPTALTPWPATGGHRLAGVSGFGFSGTNAHVVIESAPDESAVQPSNGPRGAHVLAMSARNDAALGEMAAQYATWIGAHPELSLADACATANTGRSTLPQRMAVVATSPAELVDRLTAFADTGADGTGVVVGRAARPRVAFLFTGQGAQYAGMARGLYDTEPAFRTALDRCAELMDPQLSEPLLTVLFADEGTPAAALLDHTGFTQPALFAVEHSLCELWRSWGVAPEAMLGHSIGELVAATEAGVFSLDDAIRLVVARGALMQALPDGGAMVAVDAALGDIESAVGSYPDLAVAAINGPAHTVVSGGGESVAAVSAEFTGRGLRVRPLTVSHAFHSPLMLPMLDNFRRVAESVTYRTPKGRLVSNVSGAMAGPEVASADYWVRHVMAPVRFSDGIAALRGAGIDAFVEIGPHPVLTAMGQTCVPDADVTWAPSLRRKRGDSEQILSSLGQLFTVGARVDWSAVRADGRRRAMPTYPFQRQRHWLDPAPRTRRVVGSGHPLLGATINAPLLGATIHEVVVAHDSPSWLGDHRLSATVVFPATAYTEMVLAAAAGEIESLSILEPLIVPDDGDVTVQTVVTERDGRREVQILSLATTAAPYTVHARAIVRTDAASRDADHDAVAIDVVDIGGFADEFTDEVDVADYYDHLYSIGLTYGPTFRGLTTLRRRDGAAVGLVELPADVGDSAGLVLHPALFDACFHVLGVAVAPLDRSASDDMYVPVSIQGLRLHRGGATAAWCVVTILDDDTPLASRAVCVAQLQLYGTDGASIATVDRLEVRRTPKSIWQRGLGVARDPIYELTWRGEQRPATAVTPAREWLIVADAAGTGDALAEALRQSGARCSVVAATSAGTELADVIDAALQRAASPVGVVHLRALDLTDDGHDGDVEHGLGSALTAAQSLAARPTAGARLFIVTSGAQSVEGESPIATAATLWGLGRVVANEQPDMACTCIDLDPRSDATIDDLAAELLHAAEDDQVAYRGRHRLVARLAAVTAARAIAHVAPDAPYELTLSERGSLDALRFRPMLRRQPMADEVEIEVRASGVNFRDVLNVLGMYPGDPGTPGMECSGVVTAVGPDVRNVAIGDAVVGIAPGAFASHVVTPADLVVALPDALTFADAASVPVAFMTAAYGLQHLAGLQPGERVLIHAAAGGVGMAAVQIAHRIGAEVFATVGSTEKRQVLQRLGVRHIYNSRTLDFANEVIADTGGAGVDVVLNSLSDDFVSASFEALAANGRFLEIGKRGIWSAERAATERPLGRYHAYDLADLVTDTTAFQSLLRTVVDDIGTGHATPLPVRAFSADEIEHAFRFMAQARHIGKVVVTHRPDAPHVRGDGAYLVTGGLGGIGLAVGAWLVDQGARHLTLVGRSAPSAEASTAIDSMRAAGATVHTIQADIGDPTGVERVMAAATGDGVALRGVFHAAGITDDGALGQQTWTRFQRVLAPKLVGAALLDRATRALDLDHFVLFSSAAAILGAPGQSAYAAANNALDAIAHRRRASGRPALSVNWGAWADAGMAARLDDRHKQRLAERGVGAIPAAEALAVMDRLLGQSAAQVAVLSIDWPTMLAALDTVPPLLADMARAPLGGQAVPARTSSRRLADELLAVDVDERGEILRAAVEAQIVTVLGLDPRDTIDGRQGLSDLGMDSLMAVELSNRLSALLDRSLPSTIPFEYPTLDELAAHITQLLAEEVEFADHFVTDHASAMNARDSLLDMSTIDVEDALLRELDDAGY